MPAARAMVSRLAPLSPWLANSVVAAASSALRFSSCSAAFSVGFRTAEDERERAMSEVSAIPECGKSPGALQLTGLLTCASTFLREYGRVNLRIAFTTAVAAAMLAGCASSQRTASAPLACDDGIKTAFKPDANTRVVAVRRVAKGTQVTAVDSQKPVTAVRDMCLVK